MFGRNNILKQQIKPEAQLVLSADIKSYIPLKGKYQYKVVFDNSLISNINLYFKVIYKKSKSAVSSEKETFKDFITQSTMLSTDSVDLDYLILIRDNVNISIDKDNDITTYNIHFSKSKWEFGKEYEGNIIFDVYANDVKQNIKYTKEELKIIKAILKILRV